MLEVRRDKYALSNETLVTWHKAIIQKKPTIIATLTKTTIIAKRKLTQGQLCIYLNSESALENIIGAILPHLFMTTYFSTKLLIFNH